MNVAGPSSLKRKRPPMLQIPLLLQEIQMEAISHRDSISQENDLAYRDNGVAVSSIKGKKKFMEDAYKISVCPPRNSIKHFFGVYDGHGGVKAMEFVAEHLHCNILENLRNCMGDEAKIEAIKAAYLRTDHDFLARGSSSGVCCVTALIGSKEVISNLGDCRGVLCRGGVAEALTEDHRVDEGRERERVKNKGGYVEMNKGAWRVHGVLSVSRSIGDAHLKVWLSSEPETRILNLTPEMKFLVLASDGLWEKVGNQEAVDVLLQSCSDARGQNNGEESEKENDCVRLNWSPPRKRRRRISAEKKKAKKLQGGCSSGLGAACEELVKLALGRGSLDDITVMIIDLNYYYHTR